MRQRCQTAQYNATVFAYIFDASFRRCCRRCFEAYSCDGTGKMGICIVGGAHGAFAIIMP